MVNTRRENMIRKYQLISVLIIATLVSLTGCRIPGEQYAFSQNIDQITAVNICSYDYKSKSMVPLKALNSDEWQALVNDVVSLEVRRHFGDHTQDYGEVVICISYENSEAEVVGIWNVATIDSEGNWHIGFHYFEGKPFSQMLLKYIDIELVPELNKYLESTA